MKRFSFEKEAVKRRQFSQGMISPLKNELECFRVGWRRLFNYAILSGVCHGGATCVENSVLTCKLRPSSGFYFGFSFDLQQTVSCNLPAGGVAMVSPRLNPKDNSPNARLSFLEKNENDDKRWNYTCHNVGVCCEVTMRAFTLQRCCSSIHEVCLMRVRT